MLVLPYLPLSAPQFCRPGFCILADGNMSFKAKDLHFGELGPLGSMLLNTEQA